MRVANISMYDSIKQTLGRASTEMFEANEVVSTSKRINKLSDDPVGLVSVLDLKSSLANIEQLGRNINMGKTWLASGESSLQQISNILSDVKEITVQMSTATTNSTQRANAVTFIDGYLRQVKSLANTEVGGRYIFSGTETDTIPFDFNSDESQVIYSGNDIPFAVKTGRNTKIDIGSDGQEIFGGDWADGNIFKTLVDLKSYLNNNDINGIQSTLDKIDANMNSVSNSISEIGGKTVRLNVRENIIQELEISYTERKSNLEGADMAEAIMNLKAKELAYNAALSSASKVMQISLVNYL
ncbi:flagellar hook-associated protein FlgL [Thermodesulfobacteriota bacterium]